MFQWFIRFPEFAEFIEFLIHLGKTPINTIQITFQTDVVDLKCDVENEYLGTSLIRNDWKRCARISAQRIAHIFWLIHFN